MDFRPLPKKSLLAAISAIVFFFATDAAITRSGLLWAPTSFERSSGSMLVFGQVYLVLRRIYGESHTGSIRVAILGNSRVHLGVRETTLVELLTAHETGHRFRVDNLALFGSGPVTTNLVWRHLRRDPPDLTVLALGPTDLLTQTMDDASRKVTGWLSIGFSDPAGDPWAAERRLDRWLRTFWPLYRFREFARSVLDDRIARREPPPPLPERFHSRHELFEWFRPDRVDIMDLRYREWEMHPDLEHFVRFLEAGRAEHLGSMRRRVARGVVPDDENRHLAALDELLGELARTPGLDMVLMMPESPLLAQDTAGLYHIDGYSDRGTQKIRALAALHGIEFVDGRQWLTADRFLDLEHPLPDLSGFEARLAQELVRAMDSLPAVRSASSPQSSM